MALEVSTVAESGSTIWLITAALVGGGWLLIAVLAGVALFVSRLVLRRLERLNSTPIGESGRLLYDLFFKVVLTAALLAGITLAGMGSWLAWLGRAVILGCGASRNSPRLSLPCGARSDWPVVNGC